MYSPVSSHVLVTSVMLATTSIALASRLVAGLKRVMSPVPAGMATVGQAERVVMTPRLVSSPSRLHPRSASDRRAGRATLGLITNIDPRTWGEA